MIEISELITVIILKWIINNNNNSHILSLIPDWSSLLTFPKKLTPSIWRVKKWRSKTSHPFVSKKLKRSQQQWVSALIGRLKSHIPVSSLFSLYFYFSFVCSYLTFSNNLQPFIAQWSSFIRGKKKYCATEVIVCEDSLW